MYPKTILKPWGSELWIADGTTTPYALKRIKFLAGNRTSLQVHKFKHETNYVLSGIGKLYISHSPFDIESFLHNGMTTEEVNEYESKMAGFDVTPGSIMEVRPGYVHRVVAFSDLEFMEVSTTELDDVIRLQDDSGRTHGKIQSEHSL